MLPSPQYLLLGLRFKYVVLKQGVGARLRARSLTTTRDCGYALLFYRGGAVDASRAICQAEVGARMAVPMAGLESRSIVRQFEPGAVAMHLHLRHGDRGRGQSAHGAAVSPIVRVVLLHSGQRFL
jgi:hypothetical protein